MRKILILLVMMLLIPSFVWAASSVTFAWDANTEPDLAGYRLYQAAASGAYDYTTSVLTIPVGTNTGTIQVQDGTWFWVLRAYDTSDNESNDSNEVSARALDSVDPDAPSGLTITIIIKVK